MRQKSVRDGNAGSRALAKGIEIQRYLAGRARVPLTGIAREIGLGKASTLRLLETLVSAGVAVRDPNGGYGARGNVALPPDRAFLDLLIQSSRSDMERLNADLAETVSLAVLRDDHIRVVATIESPRHMRMANYVNRILPPYASSLGKAIAAWQTPERQQLLLQVYGIYRTTDKTITEPLLIREEFKRIRARGYSNECEETVPGGSCIGAPIAIRHRAVESAISVSMPASRLTPKLERLVPELLMKAAARIARNLEKSIK